MTDTNVVPLPDPKKPSLTLRFTMTVIREMTVDPRDYSDDGVTPEPVDAIIAAELNALEQYPVSFLKNTLDVNPDAITCTGFTVERVA